jgi:hypothetical protein
MADPLLPGTPANPAGPPAAPAAAVDDWWLADSELLRLEPVPGGWALQVAAAAVQRQWPGPPPVSLSGHLSRLTLWLGGGSGSGGPAPAAAPGRLRSGSQLQVNGQRLVHLRLPFQAEGECVLTLSLGDGSELSLSGHRVVAQAAPDARFHESLAC